MKSIDDIARQRLFTQRLAGTPLASPGSVVEWMVAVQAQDHPGTKWGIAQRTRGATDAEVEAALARGDLLRTHVLRPTWHVVRREDIRWLLALTAPKVISVMKSYDKLIGLVEKGYPSMAALGAEVESYVVDGKTFWSMADAPTSPRASKSPAIHLLPNWDELVVAYRDHSVTLDDAAMKSIALPQRGLTSNVVTRDGRVIGTWRRTIGKKDVHVDVTLLAPLKKTERPLLEAARQCVGAFLGLPVHRDAPSPRPPPSGPSGRGGEASRR